MQCTSIKTRMDCLPRRGAGFYNAVWRAQTRRLRHILSELRWNSIVCIQGTQRRNNEQVVQHAIPGFNIIEWGCSTHKDLRSMIGNNTWRHGLVTGAGKRRECQRSSRGFRHDQFTLLKSLQGLRRRIFAPFFTGTSSEVAQSSTTVVSPSRGMEAIVSPDLPQE